MSDQIVNIATERLRAHPDNPNRMSAANLKKLVSNIKATGNYEPIVVRRLAGEEGFYQIINGHHRKIALDKIGEKTARCVVWDIDDRQADVLLLTLNRLQGTDRLGKKLAILRRLNDRIDTEKLSKLVPQSTCQIKKMLELNRPSEPVKGCGSFAEAMVFFVSAAEKKVIEGAIDLAVGKDEGGTKAGRNAKGLLTIAESFVERQKGTEKGKDLGGC